MTTYTYRAEWSPEDGEYVGLCAEFPSLSWLAPTGAEAIAGIEELVVEALEDIEDVRSVVEREHDTIPAAQLWAELGIADELQSGTEST